MDLASFRDRFPEFDDLPDSQVNAALAQAERTLDATVWGNLLDDGHGQLTAHLLALAPSGTGAGLRMGGGANQRTAYQGEYERLEKIVGGAYRMVLD